MTSNINLYQDLDASQLGTLKFELPNSRKAGKEAEESASKASDAAGVAAENSSGSKNTGGDDEKCFFDWDLDEVEREMEKATQSEKKEEKEEGNSGGLRHGTPGKKGLAAGLSTMSIKEKSTAKEEK